MSKFAHFQVSLLLLAQWLLSYYALLATWLSRMYGRAKGYHTALPITKANPYASLSATDLALKIRNRELTSRTVVETFIEHIEYVNPKLNAMVKTRFIEALREADAADQLIASGKHDVQKQPFLGVPCSIKECFMLKGMPNTVGLVKRLKKYSSVDDTAISVQRMIDAGFIPLGVTNTSELGMWYESSNRVYGITKNPYSFDRIVGGSSGGEAAIISSCGAPCGIGSDVGGSVRMPAFFCGIFGHKPSSQMVPNTGHHPLPRNEGLEYLSAGPMCRHASDLYPMLQVIAGPDNMDPSCKPIKLKDPTSVDFSKVHFLSLENDGGNLLTEPVDPELVSAQRKVRALLLELGAKEVVMNISEFKYSFDIWAALMEEAKSPSFSSIMGEGKEINSGLELIKWVFGASHHTLPAAILGLVEKLPSKLNPGKHKHYIQVGKALKKKVRDALGDNGVLLYPAHPVPAPYHHRPLLTLFNFAYTAIFNILGLPSTQCPVGLSKDNLPLGIQVIANHGQDHLTIRVAQEIEKKYGGWIPPWNNYKLKNQLK